MSDESLFEIVSQCRQIVRRPRGPVETRVMPQYLVKSCKGQIMKIMVWGAIWSSSMRVIVRVTGTPAAGFQQFIPIWDDDHLLLQVTPTKLRQ